MSSGSCCSIGALITGERVAMLLRSSSNCSTISRAISPSNRISSLRFFSVYFRLWNSAQSHGIPAPELFPLVAKVLTGKQMALSVLQLRDQFFAGCPSSANPELHADRRFQAKHQSV